jgi:hypothetical protein
MNFFSRTLYSSREFLLSKTYVFVRLNVARALAKLLAFINFPVVNIVLKLSMISTLTP